MHYAPTLIPPIAWLRLTRPALKRANSCHASPGTDHAGRGLCRQRASIRARPRVEQPETHPVSSLQQAVMVQASRVLGEDHGRDTSHRGHRVRARAAGRVEAPTNVALAPAEARLSPDAGAGPGRVPHNIHRLPVDDELRLQQVGGSNPMARLALIPQ